MKRGRPPIQLDRLAVEIMVEEGQRRFDADEPLNLCEMAREAIDTMQRRGLPLPGQGPEQTVKRLCQKFREHCSEELKASPTQLKANPQRARRASRNRMPTPEGRSMKTNGRANGTLKSLKDFPEWIEARDAWLKDHGDLIEAEEALKRSLRRRTGAVRPGETDELADQAHERAIAEVAEAVIGGEPLPSAPNLDREALEFRVSVLLEVVAVRSQNLLVIENRLRFEILQQAIPEHRRRLAEVLKAAEALAAAIETEDAFVTEVRNAGASVSSLPRYWPVINVVGTRSNPSSGINEMSLQLGPYIAGRGV